MIQVLDSAVVDKIAAGEVLERPAQLIKELVENSLDAGATEIEVDVNDGGRTLSVKDNGCGIPKDEMPLALMRHATSKITQVEDLFQLHSFGFRGEALSSAASVSQLVLTSRTATDETGHRMVAEFGRVQEPLPISASRGCEVRVSQLFDNVPARKKFLKSDSSELNQIKQCFKSFGLSRPDVSFKFTKDGEVIYFWPKEAQSGQGLERAQDVLDFSPLYLAQGEENGIQVKAFFGAPNQTLRQNRGFWLFVQGRWVQDRALGAAVMEAYRNLLMHGEYPHCVLFLQMPLDDVDVNVHPTKSQVRFSKPSDVFRAVVHVLRDGLAQTPWLKKDASSFAEARVTDFFELRAEAFNPAPSPADQMTFLDRELKKTQLQKKDFVLHDSGIVSPNLALGPTPSMPVAVMNHAPQATFRWADLQVVGQAAHTYILAQTESEFYMIDQHAAHERVVFERLMKNWKDGSFTQQNFLLPLHLDFSEEEIENLMSQKDELTRMGVEIEQAGPQTLAIMAIPDMIKESGIAKALRIFSDQLKNSGGGFAVEHVIADIFASMSCHSVVRAGQALSADEMKSLLVQMDEFPFSSFCPHGRPVYVKKSFYQIDREFGRIV